MIGLRFVGLQFWVIMVFSFIGFPKMTTAEDGPKVGSLTAYFDEPSKSIFVNWTKPSEINGILRGYSVKLVHQKWRHPCSVPVPQIAFNVSSEVNSVVFNSTQFKFSSAYAVYVSAITDKKGPEMMTAILTPESIPEAGPNNLTVTRVTSTGYRLEWETPDCAFSNGRITFNITAYGLPIKSEYILTSIVYTELAPNTEYEDTIIPCTNAGCGKQTASITVTTLAPRPRPGPPRDLTVYSVTDDSLSFTWLPPDSSFTWLPSVSSPKKIRKYGISFKKNPSAKSSFYKYEQKEVEKLQCENSELRRDRLCYTITSLEPRTDYDIHVTAIDDKGEESIKKETHTTGRTEDKSPKVGSLTAYFDEPSKSIFVNWTKPSEINGILRGYSVKLVHQKWRHPCSVPVPQIAFNVSSEVNSVVFNSTQFKFSSSYAVYVSAITDKKGPELMKAILTPESIPEAGPKNLTVTSLTSTGYRLKWETPDCAYSNGRITFNITSYGVPTKREYTSTSIGFIDLIPNTVYEDTIIACTTAGCGKQTASITVKTLPSKPRPGPPRDLTVYSVTINSLSITWLPPISSASNVTEYKISYIKNPPVKSSTHLYDKKKVETLQCKNSKLRHGRLCHTININLEPRTDFDIYVTAIDDMGEESIRKEAHVTGRTEESKPEAPSKLELENSTTTSLFVSWLEPVRANGKLIEYRINVKLINLHGLGCRNGSVVYSFVQRTPEVTIHNITGLEPASTYNVTVEAATSAGYGPPVHKLFYTRNSAPKVTVRTEIGEIFTIQLLIKPMDNCNRTFSAYFVLVKDVTNKQVKREALELRTYNQSKIEYVAAKLNPSLLVSEGVNFTIGDGEYYDKFYNAPLQNGHEYIFGTAVLKEVDDEQQIIFEYLDEAVYVSTKRLPQMPHSLTSPLIPQMGFIISTLILAVILVFVLIFFILHCKKPELFRCATKETSTNNKIESVKPRATFTKPAEANVYEEIDTKSVYLMNLNDECSTDSVDVNQSNPNSPTYVNCLAQRQSFT